MAIIYSYPRVNALNGSDLLIGTRFENEDSGSARSVSFTVETLGDYVAATYAPTLDQVLTAGNESLLNANINYLYLYDYAETEYGHVRISDSGFDVFDANNLIISRIDRGGITIAGPSYGSVILTGTITANRNYTLPNKSGTFAMTSDIISPSTYGIATQTANSTPITNSTDPGILNGTSIIGTLTIPANGFSIGDSFNAFMVGHISNNNGVTLLITVETVAGVVLGSTGAMNLNIATNKHWQLNLDFVVRAIGGAGTASIVTAGNFSYNKNSNNNAETFTFVTENNTTFNTTTANELVIKATWGAVSPNNSIYSNIFVLNKVY